MPAALRVAQRQWTALPQAPWLGWYGPGSWRERTAGALPVSVDSEPYGEGSTMRSAVPRDSTKLPALGLRWSSAAVRAHAATNQIAWSSQLVRANSVAVPAARYQVGHDARGGSTGGSPTAASALYSSESVSESLSRDSSPRAQR